ncbi:ChbG/HpnK family deacetylase [Pyxidicoccus sp. 3LG]
MRRALESHGVATNAHFIGDAGAEAYWTLERLEEQLAALPASGVIELMCHPGYAPEAVRSGYSAQREVELETFVAPRARELLARAGVVPTDFSVLTPAS